MTEATLRTNWLVTARAVGWLLVYVAVVGGGSWYLWTGHFQPFDLFHGWMRLAFVFWGVSAAVALASGALEQIAWCGPLPVDSETGYSWRRSIRSRLEKGVALANIWPIFWTGDVTQQALAAQDWGRFLVAAGFTAGLLWIGWRSIREMFSGRIVLSIDDEGVRSADMAGGFLPWDRVERIVVTGDLDARRVTLMTLRNTGAAGPAVTLELGGAGVPARRFLAYVAELAPQTEITWPLSRIASFG
jgi:hypothetical protein